MSYNWMDGRQSMQVMTEVPVTGGTVALRTERGGETSVVIAEIQGTLARIVGACFADAGEEVAVAWISAGRVVRARALVLQHLTEGAWVDIRETMPVAGRWLHRSVPRGTVLVDLHLHDHYGQVRLVAGGRLRDVGLGGAGIIVPEPVYEAETGDAVFIAPDGRALAAASLRILRVTVHPRGYVAGCQFASLGEGGAVVTALGFPDE
jgi:hypothetical protein